VSSLLIRNARILDAEGMLEGDVLVEGNTIRAVGQVGTGIADEVLEAAGRVVIPGLVNTHTHAAMVLFRGYTDDVPLMEWLEKKIWPLEKHVISEHVYQGTRLACLEMLASGTTTFHDMYFFGSAAARAADELGLRAVISQVFFDVFEKKSVATVTAELEAGLAELAGFRTVRPSIGPHAPYTVSLEALAQAARVAEKHEALLHFHVAETEDEIVEFSRRQGKKLVRALDEIGFLSSRLVAAHGIWLDDEDMERLATRGVTISHCPTSNMKLCSGWSPSGARALPYRALRRAGVRVALGTDGAASNNSLDMFQTMKLAALLQKHSTGDPTALPAREAFAMATVEGARALGLRAGLVAPGYLADLVILDLDRPYFSPGHDLLADLVYAARADCVETVVVDGKVVLRGGRRDDAADILQAGRAAARDLIQRAGSA
jgi:5-methylthioadenosine/S-adenosylhomocysteine deaminase